MSTIIRMMFDRHCWSCGKTFDWKFSAVKTWHDGPVYVCRFGPFWVMLSYIEG